MARLKEIAPAEGEILVEFGQDLIGIISGADNNSARGNIIITHGAGQGIDSPLLTQTAQELAKLNFTVLRFNFAYMTRGSAPSAGGKKERPDLLAAIEYMKNRSSLAPIMIGRSFGCRVIADIVAANPTAALAIVFYGLPLQGLSKTSKPRDWSHLAKLTAPTLFITGDKDKLCPLDQLNAVIAKMNAPITSLIVPGDHSYKPRSVPDAVRLCVEWVDKLVVVDT